MSDADPAPQPPRRSPRGAPPAWLPFLFPSMTGLEENPLYIRLSGQGYRRRPKWYQSRIPPEFRPPNRGVIDSPFLPLGLIFGPGILMAFARATIYPAGPAGGAMAAANGIILTLSSLASLSGWVLLSRRSARRAASSAIHHFFDHAAAEPWAEDLYLASLEPADIGRALFAAVFPRIARNSAIGLFLLAAVGYPVHAFILYNALEMFGIRHAIEYWICALPIALAIWLHAFTHTALTLGYNLDSVTSRIVSKRLAMLGVQFLAGFSFLLCVAAGLLSVWGVSEIWSFRARLPAPIAGLDLPYWGKLAAGALAYIPASAGLGFIFARSQLAHAPAKAGLALRWIVHRKSSP